MIETPAHVLAYHAIVRTLVAAAGPHGIDFALHDDTARLREAANCLIHAGAALSFEWTPFHSDHMRIEIVLDGTGIPLGFRVPSRMNREFVDNLADLVVVEQVMLS